MGHFFVQTSWLIYVDEFLNIESIISDYDSEVSKSIGMGEFNN